MRILTLALCCLGIAACGGGSSSPPPPASPPPPPPPPANTAPTVAGVTAGTLPDTAVTGTLVGTDADGDSLDYAVGTMPANGMVSLAGAGNVDFTYTPNAGFAGTDSFTYTASDGTATSGAGTVTITVNTPPTVTAANYETSDIVPVSDTLVATDAEVNSVTFSIATQPAKGDITSLATATGAFVYTATDGEDGVDTFEVTASDFADTSAPATITVEIFDWVGTTQIGSAGDDATSTNGLVARPGGSLLHAGLTDGQLGSTPNAGGDDIFVRITDRRGNETGIAQLGSTDDDRVRGVHARNADDGYYFTVQSNGDNVYRFDADGNEIWSVPLSLPTNLSVVATVYWSSIDRDDNLYALSWISRVANTFTGVVTKIDGATGNILWQRELRSSEDDGAGFFIGGSSLVFPRGVDVDSNGDVIVTGEFADTGVSMRSCQRCPFIAKFDSSDGSDIWLREPDTFDTCGKDGSGRFFRVKVDDDDTLVLSGIGDLVVSDNGDGAVARFSADGTTEQWSFCDNSGDDVTFFFTNPLITANGDIVIYGDVGDADSPPDMNGLPTERALVIYRLDGAGNQLWARTINGRLADGSTALLQAGSIIEDSQGVLYATATTNGQFAPATNAGGTDVVILRLDADGNLRE